MDNAPSAATAQAAPRMLTIADVQQVVANYYRVRVADLCGDRKYRSIAVPRHIAMYLSYKLCHVSYTEIGACFGRRDHSTVITSCRKIARLVDGNSVLARIVSTLERRLFESIAAPRP